MYVCSPDHSQATCRRPFDPNIFFTGKHMVNGKRLIALCTSSPYESQVYGFIKALNGTLQAADCALLVFTINSDIYWDENNHPAEAYVYDLIPYDDIDCVMIMDEKIKSHTISRKIISDAKRAGVTVVVVDGSYEDTVHVGFDYDAGFEEITRHIIEYHHAKRPHMMAGIPGNEFSERRIGIFKKVIAENGIEFNESMLSYGDFWADPTREAMAGILKRDELPDAIICANDIMAINVIDMLNIAGIKIPEQVMVSGFDGYNEAYFTTPVVATCSCDTIHLAEAAAEVAIRIADHAPVSDTYITPHFIPNESCGCPKNSWFSMNMMSNFNNNFYRHQDDNRIMYAISSKMQTSPTLWDMAAAIHNHKTKKSLTVVDMNIFDLEENYFMKDFKLRSTPDFHIINDADYAEEHRFERRPLPDELFYDTNVNTGENVLSGNYRDRILELCNSGYPLTFNALDYLNRPFGFNCYYFDEFAITNYSKSAIVTNAISMGIGGFVNLQYQKKLLEKVDNMYKHDALTGLYNRIGFLKVYDDALSEVKNPDTPVTLIMSDLDGLKYINDTFGHADGDRSIAAVATALRDACPEHALNARFGGDELFSVIIGECDADAIIRRIDAELERYNAGVRLPYTVSTSSGAFTTVINSDFDILKALKIADERMYAVKCKKRYYIQRMERLNEKK